MPLNEIDIIQEPSLVQTVKKPVLSSKTARAITLENLNKLRDIEIALENSLVKQ